MDLKNSNLAFLLSLTALPIGGCVINGDDDDDGGDTGTSTQTTTATTTATTTVSTTDADTTAADTTVSTTVADTGTDEETTAADTGPEDSGTTGDVPAVCDMVGAHYMKCQIKDPQAIIDECVLYTTDPKYTEECVQANEDYYACLAAADCKALTGKEPPCTAEQDAILEICLGGDETTGG